MTSTTIQKSPRLQILLLGGHGKISMLMTPLMLAKKWNVTSVVRNPDHKHEIMALATDTDQTRSDDSKDAGGSLDVLVESLEDIKDVRDAQKLVDRVKPDYIIWSAGAGGKGGASRTFAVDRDAAKAFIEAGAKTPSVCKFLLVSYLYLEIASRRNRPAWWTDEDWASAQKVNTEVLANYYKAKVEADEYFVAWAEKRRRSGDADYQAINLRPGTLTDDNEGARKSTKGVRLGQTPSRGEVSRNSVARVAVALLEREDTKAYYYDLLDGRDVISEAVDRVVREEIDCLEGEDKERIYGLL